MRRMGRHGFTLIELLVVIGIVALAISILLPLMNRARERSMSTKCGRNLRSIGQALALYANDFGCYPRTAWDPEKPCPVQFDNAGCDSPDSRTVSANNVSAAIFLLARNCDIHPEVFICPFSLQEKDTLGGQVLTRRSNFTSADNLSYSFTNPYPQRSAEKLKYRWSPQGPADFAIAADRNDGTRDPAATVRSPLALQKAMNSSNHEREGQNVLFNDGHVEWVATPWAGASRDNIYTRAKTVPGVNGPMQADPPASDPEGFPEPALELDSVLVPVFPSTFVAPAAASKPEAAWKTPIVLGVLGLLAAMVLAAVIQRARKSPPAPRS